MSCGGTSDVKDATEEIQKLIEEVRHDLEAKAGAPFSHYKAVSYKSQVVAGTNFFVKIQTDDNAYIHARIFRALPHANSSLSVHSHQSGKTREDAIEYF
jgi:cystatin-A/B